MNRPLRSAPAFSLAEMLVALAVLALAMGVVSTVFSLTSRTAAQSAAYAEVEAAVRSWLLRLEEDCKGIDPRRSVLVMHGRTVPASLNEVDRVAGRHLRYLVGDPNNVPLGFDPTLAPEPLDPNVTQYSNPRADILGFFTNTPAASKAPPKAPGASNVGDPNFPYVAGAKLSPQFVTYGHAALARVTQTSAGPPALYDYAPGPAGLEHIADAPANARSRIPAVRWHLARRGVIIEPPPYDGTPTTYSELVNALSGSGTGASGVQVYPRILRCQNTGPDAGDVIRFDFETFLRMMGPRPPNSGLVSGPWDLARLSPYNASRNVVPVTALKPQWPPDASRLINRLMYPSGNADPNSVFHHMATVIEAPPANLTHNLGVHGLPGVAWFQVEFLMPEDARYSYDAVDSQASVAARNRRSDLPRWTEVERGATFVFVPDTTENRALVAAQVNDARVPLSGSRLADYSVVDPALVGGLLDTVDNRRIRLWPHAIRVTVRVYDRLNRLPDPIVRSFVHRFE